MNMLKQLDRRSLIISLALLTVGASFATYNLVTLFTQDQGPLLNRPRSNLANDLGRHHDPVMPLPESRKLALGPGPKFHVAVTATDSGYSKWQSRIMYYWYSKFKDAPGSSMGGFTRILHSGRPDNLMDEIPTFVVDPLPEGVDKGYIVLNRPWAFVQWLAKANIEEEYILMGEPDHIFVKPLPNLASGKYPAAYPFFYIEPEKYPNIIRRFFPEEKGPISAIEPIGNSPVIILKSQLKEIAPTWLNVSLSLKDDKEADQTFDWVQEMYAYSIASALHGVKHILHEEFMIQPPRELEIGKSYIIHYTYGCDYNMKGELTYGEVGEWSFNKRRFGDNPPPRNLTLPPPGVPESVVTLVNMVNEATANIPGWENA